MPKKKWKDIFIVFVFLFATVFDFVDDLKVRHHHPIEFGKAHNLLGAGRVLL